MGVVTMNMSGYEVEREEAAEPRYGEEVLSAGWVPTLAVHQARTERAAMPAELATVDVDEFLRKMYACQR